MTDRGFSSAANRRTLQLRQAAAALARAGRYRVVAGNLRIKEIKPRPEQGVLTDRFIVCHNPEQAERGAAVREQLLAQLRERIDGSDQLSTTKRAERRGRISTMPGLNRYLRLTGGGLLRVDADAVRRESHLDGSQARRSARCLT